VFFVYGAHQRRSRWKNLIDKNEDSLLWGKLNALADHIYKLSNGQILEDV